MIVSAARLHGRASSRRRVYRRGGRNDNQAFEGLSCLHNPRRDLAAQPLQTEQRVGAGLRDLDALGGKMLAEEIEMRRGFVELLRCQHRRKYRHFGAQLHIQQSPDHGFRDIFVIDHEPCRDDRGVAPGLGEQLDVQRDFERPRHFEQIDARALDAALLDLAKECEAALFDHLAVPGRLHEGDPLWFCESRVHASRRRIAHFRGVLCFRRIFCFGSVLRRLIHGLPLSGPESGHTERRAAWDMRLSRPFSFIRTLTVGFGIAPNLLALPVGEEGARGLGLRHPYRRWGFSPRPENIYPPGMSGLLELWPMAAAPARALAWGIRMSPCRQSETGSGKISD